MPNQIVLLHVNVHCKYQTLYFHGYYGIIICRKAVPRIAKRVDHYNHQFTRFTNFTNDRS